jgi:octaprenyl-diphosphate synthase
VEISQLNLIINKSINSTTPLLNNIVNYFFKLKSKRLRPLLAITCNKLFSGDIKEIDIKLAAAIELLHTATLLHDDVIDNSFMRRFEQTVNAKWDNKASILAGDVLLSRSFSLILEAGSFDVLESFNIAINNLVDGEIENLNFQKTNTVISEEQYWKLIGKKTADLFCLACKIPAITSSQDLSTIKLISEFGYLLGMIFQVTDDILDYKVDNILGKNCGDDFFEGKITLPIIFLLQTLEEDTKKQLIQIFSATVRSYSDMIFIQKLLLDYKIHARLDNTVLKLHDDCITLLNQMHLNNKEFKNILILMVEYCAKRIN